MNNLFLKKIFSNLTKWQVLLIIAIYILLMVGLAIITPKLIDQEQLRNFVANRGLGGIIIFSVIEYLYVIFVPLYNTPIHMAAGYIFGGSLGWLINFIATSAGLFTIIILIKKFGRPLLERIVSKKFIQSYDNFTGQMGPIALFIVYVLPITPDDEITYLLAASPVKFSRFILPVMFGNITKSALSFIGDQGSSGLKIAIGSRLIIFIIGIIFIGLQEFLYFKKHGSSKN